LSHVLAGEQGTGRRPFVSQDTPAWGEVPWCVILPVFAPMATVVLRVHWVGRASRAGAPGLWLWS
jgi:hypothetical protein